MWFLLIGCTPPQSVPFAPAPPEASLSLERDRFVGVRYPEGADTFDATTADLDLDGDLDLLLNRHLDYPLELYDNVGGGHFVQLNPRGDDRSGLYDNAGVPDLYSEPEPMLAAVEASGQAGLFLWHDLNRSERWRLSVELGAEVVRLALTVNRPLRSFDGIAPADVHRIDDFHAELRLTGSLQIAFDNELIGTQLKLEVLDPTPPPTIFVGTTLTPFPDGRVDLFKDDPHGLTLIDVLGSPEPEILVNRGGLIGQLLPPHDPKTDHLFEYVGGETLYTQALGVVPPNYGRGRQIAWFDVDGDGQDELYAANTETESNLLDLEGGAVLIDRAPELGLDLVPDDTFAWMDLDDDGFLDLISGHGRTTRVLYHRPDRYEEVDGASVGLIWPEDATPGDDGIFNPLAMTVLDVDRDGDLDLIATDDRYLRLFRREGGRFVDAGASGLPQPSGRAVMLQIDANHDGFMDLLVGSGELWIAFNQGGHFVAERYDDALGIGAARIGAPGDLDGDGYADAVLFTSTENLLLRTTGPEPAPVVEVVPDAPLGSIVRGIYADGSVLAQQWGGTTISRYSQGLRPLRFGTATGPLLQLSLQRPGQIAPDRYVAVPPGARRVAL